MQTATVYGGCRLHIQLHNSSFLEIKNARKQQGVKELAETEVKTAESEASAATCKADCDKTLHGELEGFRLEIRKSALSLFFPKYLSS